MTNEESANEQRESAPMIAVVLAVLGWLSVVVGLLMILSMGMTLAGFTSGAGIAGSGLLLVGFAAAIKKLHQIEVNTRLGGRARN